ncbi:hypothetical protein [Marichromatium sp. AB32]|uniref:hypothetical protein n=1 Tax=Marichromatium sp. AB32 TaxID=2483363 RepID=UPI000F41D73D|nr:hypothetical protein [Marichromatium sp. AB32]RNE94521.1 hypothetical protein EBL85_01430 [Marichromatium sp. AB32]
MNAFRCITPTGLALTTVLMLPGLAAAEASATAASAAPAAQMPAMMQRMTAMQERMQTIRATQDPGKRMALMQQQMHDMQANMDQMSTAMSGCNMVQKRGHMDMMSGGMSGDMGPSGAGRGPHDHAGAGASE